MKKFLILMQEIELSFLSLLLLFVSYISFPNKSYCSNFLQIFVAMPLFLINLEFVCVLNVGC